MSTQYNPDNLLYVIGNGFDRFHGLPTCYSDFFAYVEASYPSLMDEFEEYFSFSVDTNYLWESFESDLRTFDSMAFFDAYNHTDTLGESFQWSDAFGVEDEVTEEIERLTTKIRQAFTGWIEDIVYPEQLTNYQRLPLHAAAKYLTFNYTESLELLYQIPMKNIIYLHNKANDYGELIFGHEAKKEKKTKLPTFDENGESTRTMFTDAEDSARFLFHHFKKDTLSVIKNHRLYLTSLSKITHIYILGHSLGKVDWPYFRLIAKIVPDAIWNISYYGEAERVGKHKLALKMLKCNPEKIRMIVIDELSSYV